VAPTLRICSAKEAAAFVASDASSRRQREIRYGLQFKKTNEAVSAAAADNSSANRV
jgi:hypothetical protein